MSRANRRLATRKSQAIALYEFVPGYLGGTTLTSQVEFTISSTHIMLWSFCVYYYNN